MGKLSSANRTWCVDYYCIRWLEGKSSITILNKRSLDPGTHAYYVYIDSVYIICQNLLDLRNGQVLRGSTLILTARIGQVWGWMGQPMGQASVEVIPWRRCWSMKRPPLFFPGEALQRAKMGKFTRNQFLEVYTTKIQSTLIGEKKGNGKFTMNL